MKFLQQFQRFTLQQKLEKDLAEAELKLNAMNHRNDIVHKLIDHDVDKEKELAKSLSRSISMHKHQQDKKAQLEDAALVKVGYF